MAIRDSTVESMPLEFRSPRAEDHALLEALVLESFAPITWYRKVDERFGAPNGVDWRARWRTRIRRALAEQIVLIGELEGEIAAYCSGVVHSETHVGFIDLLAVDRRFQGRGYGRAMLRGMFDRLREAGAQYADLECLTDNEAGNALYRSEGFEEVQRSIRWFKKLV